METLVLDSSHLDEVMKFLENRKRFSKQLITEDLQRRLFEGTDKCLSGHPQHRLIGCIDDGKIRALVSQTFAILNPFWIMNYFATDQNTISLSYGPHLDACFEKAMSDCEDRGFYDFWVSVPEAYANVGPRLHQKSVPWSRYHVYTDAIVPPNEFPTGDLHKHAYGNQSVKPHAVYIRHAVLKQEYRKENLTPKLKS